MANTDIYIDKPTAPLMRFFNFFKTAPAVKSQKVYQLELAGKIADVLEAVQNERSVSSEQGGAKYSVGKSKDGRISVKKVGSYHR